MNLIIHDLTKEQWEALDLPISENTRIISDNGTIHKCISCFGCWIKTPGQCIIPDEYQRMGELLAKAEEVTVISRCSFGGYSSFVKNVLDRSIPYILPFFEIRKGEMHHKSRYENHLAFTSIFYGDDITEAERETAGKLAKANALNYNGTAKSVIFVSGIEQLKGVVQ